MFYNALTGKNEPTPVEDLEPVLLWTNSNPTVEFTAQTVSLDLTDYAGVIVEFNNSDVSQKLTSRVYAKKTDDFSIFGCGYIADTGIARNILAVNDTGVQFGAVNTNTAVCIPSKIYGVKEYVVENADVIEEILTVISISSTYSGALVNLDTNHFEYTANTTGTRLSLVGTEIKALTDGIYGTTKSGNLVKSRYNAGDVISTVGSSGVVDVIAYK